MPKEQLSSELRGGLSPAARMERFAALQKRAFALLAASPEGYRRFWQRNLRKRRIHASR
jgi:hypothetical protein